LTAQDSRALLDAVRDAARGASWVVSCGSLPRGLPPSFHADVVAVAHAEGARARSRRQRPGACGGAVRRAGPGQAQSRGARRGRGLLDRDIRPGAGRRADADRQGSAPGVLASLRQRWRPRPRREHDVARDRSLRSDSEHCRRGRRPARRFSWPRREPRQMRCARQSSGQRSLSRHPGTESRCPADRSHPPGCSARRSTPGGG